MKRFGCSLMVITGMLLSNVGWTSSVAQNVPDKLAEYLNCTKTAGGMELEVSFATSIQAETGISRTFSAEFTIEESGMPVVPMSGRYFRLPANGSARLEISNEEFQVLTGVEYETLLEDSGYDCNQVGKTIEDVWYPELPATLTDPAVFHDFRICRLSTVPVQFNFLRQEARVYQSMELSVVYEQQEGLNELPEWPRKISAMFVPFYEEFLDWEPNELDNYEVSYGGIQVIVQNNQPVISALQPWINWKRQKGYDVELLTSAQIGSWSPTGIRNELRQRYSQEPFDIVVVVGDASGTISVPPSGSASYGKGDIQYTRLVGNDDIPDVGVGRISVSSLDELRKYVNKVIYYEKTPYMDETAWYTTGLVSAGHHYSGNSTIRVAAITREMMEESGYDPVHMTTYDDGQGDVNSRNIQYLNDGVSFFNYRGYINSGLSSGQIRGIQNEFMTPMVLDVTCGTGNWADTGGESLNEAWMRAGSLQEPRGGIAAYGMYTSSTNTRANNAMVAGAIWSLFDEGNPVIASTYIGANVNLCRAYDGYDNYLVNSFSTWFNLMGDPSVWVWTGVPEELTVYAASEINVNSNGYHVQIFDEDMDAVEGAWVTLTSNNQCLVKDISDVSGEVVFPLEDLVAGDLVLTVTGKNLKPYIQDLTIVDNTGIAIASYSVIDDGTNETSGNGNGLPDVGERIGVRLTITNDSDQNVSNLNVAVSEDDEEIIDVSGNYVVSSVEPGNQIEVDNLLYIEFDESIDYGYKSDCKVILSYDSGSYEDYIRFDVQAPDMQILSMGGSEGFMPGSSGELSVSIQNKGNSTLASGTATLISRSQFLTFNTNSLSYDEMVPDGQTLLDGISYSVSSATFKGTSMPIYVKLESSSGYIDTLQTSVLAGTMSPSDPSGPDRCGYYAFENTDTNYELAPTYDWVEIAGANPVGERLDINDNGENSDYSVELALPFDVTYYDSTFANISIYGNGCVAMGEQGHLNFARNWRIPEPLGPDYLIAPFWDDRNMSDPGGVYVYHDQENHRYIIEWYQVTDYHHGSSCTFQLIIFEQFEEHFTLSGNNDLLFQYHTVSASTGEGADNPYHTVGIENGEQNDGIEIEYWHRAAPGASIVSNGRAIFFTTNVETRTGTLSGQVVRNSDQQPVADVTVTLQPGGMTATTDENGDYDFGEILVGNYSVGFSKQGYNSKSEEVVVAFESASTVDVALFHPEFNLDNEGPVNIRLSNQNGGDTEETQFTISNSGDGLLDVESSIVLAPTQNLDDLWEERAVMNMSDLEQRNRGLTILNNEIWVSGSNNVDSQSPNKLYRYSLTGELLETYDQPVEDFSASGFFGITNDGEYLYGADRNMLYKMEVSENNVTYVDSWEIPSNPARFLTYDPDNDLFWMGDGPTDLFGVDREGDAQYTVSPGDGLKAISWHPDDSVGKKLYLVFRNSSGDTRLERMNPVDAGASREFLATFDNREDRICDVFISGTWNPMIWGLMVLYDGGIQDYVSVFEMEANTVWISLSDENFTVEAGESSTLNLSVSAAGLAIGEYACWVRFENNASNNLQEVPVVLTVVVSKDEEPLVQPLEWAFEGAYPNPFNPATTIRFSLKETADVSMKVYNVLGREVVTVLKRPMDAGWHVVSFNGSELSSGVYFVRFEAGPMHEVRKLVLVK